MRTGINTQETASKMKRNLWGFTIVEFLVAISILATISIIAYVSYAGHIKTANNTTRVAAIDALNLSLSDYLQQRKTLPEPNSNYITYDTLGTYVHSATSTGAYGISGYVTDNFLPKGYANFTLTDPENKQFYAYGKRIDNTSFDVAAALYDSTTGGYKTYIRGTYEKEQLSSLIRSYSSSSFVSADSTENLPYNPYERKVTAHISSFSGVLTLKNNGIPITLYSPSSFTGELNSGDIVTLGTGSTALLHISDGSELSLGSTGSQTILDLTSLSYSDENSLASKVVLLLSYGETWIEAPHLRNETDSQSDFSISTDSAVAAVRGTVFGVARNASGSTLSLKVGKIEVNKKNASYVMPFTTYDGISPTATGFVLASTSNAKSYMIVPEGGTPIELKGIQNVAAGGGPGTTSSIHTGTLTPASIGAKIYHPRFSLGYRPKPTAMSFTGTAGHTGILSLTLENPGADSYELYFGTGVTSDKSSLRVAPKSPSYTGTLSPSIRTITITGAFLYSTGAQLSRVLSLKLCYHGRCSDSDNISLTGESFSRGAFQTLGAKRTDTQRTSVIKPAASDTKLTVAGGRSLVAEANYDSQGDLGMIGAGVSLSHDYGNLLTGNCAVDSPSDQCKTSSYTNRGAYEGSLLDRSNSFAQYPSGIKGIYIDNDSNPDYLKYNFSPLTLSASGFAIEMSVRGAALKRTGSYTYTLFHFGDGNVYGKYKAGYGIYFGSGGSDSVKTGTGYWSGLRNDDFYTVRFEKSGDQYNISLKKSGGELITSTGKILPGSTNSLDHMYVGSDYSYKYQWNDIIDFVKIYQ